MSALGHVVMCTPLCGKLAVQYLRGYLLKNIILEAVLEKLLENIIKIKLYNNGSESGRCVPILETNNSIKMVRNYFLFFMKKR